MKIASNGKLIGECFLAIIMICLVALVAQARVNKGPIKKVFRASDGSRCWVQVVENGELVEYPCTGQFANAATDPSFEVVDVATQYMVDKAAEEVAETNSSEDKKLASSKLAE